MSYRKLAFEGIVAAWAVVTALLLLPQVVRAAPVEAYGRLPDLEDVSLSPDGTRLAFVGTVGEQRMVSVVSVADKRPIIVAKTGDTKVRALSWVDDDNLLIVHSVTAKLPAGLVGDKQEFAFAHVLDIHQRQLIQLKPPKGTGTLDVVQGVPVVRKTIEGAKVFFTAVKVTTRGSSPWLYSFDVGDHMTRLVDVGGQGTRAFMVDRSGEPVAASSWYQGAWRLRVKIKGDWRDLPEVRGLDAPPLLAGLDDKGQSILFEGPTQSPIKGSSAFRALSLEDGVWRTVNYTGVGLITDPRSGTALGSRRESEKYTFSFIDPQMQKAWNAILGAYPGEQVDFVSASDDHKKIIVKVFGPNSGAVFNLVDLTSGSAARIGALYSQISPEEVAPVHAIQYPAADGLMIPAYLTLPRGIDRDLPLVVLAHGGPEARDEFEFDWMAQALASRGYAVLQPQFRGSGGLSDSLFLAGMGQWGRKMQTDLSDGVRYLAVKGIVDPKRVCIAGASYGGYAALAGVTLDTGVYRCAVDVSGPSDLGRMVQYSASRSADKDSTIAYWDRYMQAEARNDPTYAAISPIKHIDKISVPVMIIHGRDDLVVPFQQSQWMVDAIKAAGKRVEFVPLSGEDHWLSRSATRQQMLSSMIKFLETNNPPGNSKVTESH